MSLFWTKNEDGEVVHRLDAEWDGNKGASWSREKWQDEANNSSVAFGTTWSHWGLGIEYEWSREQGWSFAKGMFRRQSLTLAVGPWYVQLMRCVPTHVPQ